MKLAIVKKNKTKNKSKIMEPLKKLNPKQNWKPGKENLYVKKTTRKSRLCRSKKQKTRKPPWIGKQRRNRKMLQNLDGTSYGDRQNKTENIPTQKKKQKMFGKKKYSMLIK